jgi:signal transduction histidine kinase
MSVFSIRMRLAAMYALALLIALCVTAVAVLWQQERIGRRRVDRELETLAATLANGLREELGEGHSAAEAARSVEDLVALGGHSVVIVDGKGTVLAASGAGPQLATAASEAPAVDTITTATGSWRVRKRQEGTGANAVTLVAAAPLTDVTREERESREAMMVGIPIIFVLAAGGGMYLASVSVRPVAVALESQRQFTADAAHELRTPVSVIRSTADVTLSRAHRDEPEYREALTIVTGQAGRLGRLVQNMLVLARADAGVYPLQVVDLYFDELVADCRRAVETLSRDRGVSVHCASLPEIPYRGDEDLLRQMILNLLQNAVQHAKPDSCVRVELHSDASHITLRITNTGTRIDLADQARIFDRFVQLDPSRRSEGAGLGLPIARWAADMHHGQVVLDASDDSATTFCAVLPVPSRV